MIAAAATNMPRSLCTLRLSDRPGLYEEMVIEATLRSLLASDYEGSDHRCDDGSTDRTVRSYWINLANPPSGSLLNPMPAKQTRAELRAALRQRRNCNRP